MRLLEVVPPLLASRHCQTAGVVVDEWDETLPAWVNLADQARAGRTQDYSDWLGVQMGNYQLRDMEERLAKPPVPIHQFPTASSFCMKMKAKEVLPSTCILHLFLGDPDTFQGRRGFVIAPACYESAPKSLHLAERSQNASTGRYLVGIQICPNYLNRLLPTWRSCISALSLLWVFEQLALFLPINADL